MFLNDFSVRIAGLAGDGSLLTGEILAYTLKRRGLYTVTVRDFPSNIRGLPTNLTIIASGERIYSWNDYINALIALEPKAIKLHMDDLSERGVLITDESFGEITFEKKNIFIYRIPMRTLARESFRSEIYKNTIALGFLGYIFGIEFDELKASLGFKLKGKKNEIIENKKFDMTGSNSLFCMYPGHAKRVALGR